MFKIKACFINYSPVDLTLLTLPVIQFLSLDFPYSLSFLQLLYF